MSRPEVQKIGYEIAMLGTKGFDVNDSSEKYQLRSLPGQDSLACTCVSAQSSMYGVRSRLPNLTADVGFDLATRTYAAEQMKRDQRNT